MTSDSLEDHYQKLQARFPLTLSGDYQQLVTPNGNAQEPIHRWFHLKEAFSHRLLMRVLKDTELESRGELSIIDPFVGSGTTAVSAGQLIDEGQIGSVAFRGTESNPFLHLLSAAKLRCMQEVVPDFLVTAGAVASAVLGNRVDPMPTPELSTFRTEYFPGAMLDDLMRIRAAIELVLPKPEHSLSWYLAQICLASAVEPASTLRKDGRALRVVPDKPIRDPLGTFLNTAEKISEDMFIRPARIEGRVDLADVRTPAVSSIFNGDADLAIFSPPYPNNIDYTEVYKMESWMLGLTESAQGFSEQRRRTLRSHGSLRWDDDYATPAWLGADAWDALLGPLLSAIPPGRYVRARRQLILGYADDMATVLCRIYQGLRPGGYFACVVGNSVHGHPSDQLVIASDLVIARLAEAAGFEITRIEVARVPSRKRTESQFLRESVIFGRRPVADNLCRSVT